MFTINSKHFLTGEELTKSELQQLLDTAETLRQTRFSINERKELKGQNVVLLFEKPSLRTRVSFTFAVQELGGNVLEVSSSVTKKEEPEDTIRVLSGYAGGVMIRTFDHSIVERMAKASQVPLINGLTDQHHPCQTLADLLTLKQNFGELNKVKIAYLGDGNNILHSLLLLAPYLGVDVAYACPKGCEPDAEILQRAQKRAVTGGGSIHPCTSPEEAVSNADAIYTDVWTSMGFEEDEDEDEDRERLFAGFQLNRDLYALAADRAIIMHCMPMVRGQEITDEMVEHKNSKIFQQSENRLHVQKSLLIGIMATSAFKGQWPSERVGQEASAGL